MSKQLTKQQAKEVEKIQRVQVVKLLRPNKETKIFNPKNKTL